MTKGYRRPIKLWQSAIFKTLSDSKKISPAQAPDFRVLYGKYGTPGGLRRGFSFVGGMESVIIFPLARNYIFFIGTPLLVFLHLNDHPSRIEEKRADFA